MAKVLLVEDDNNLREIFEMRLQAEGYDTVSASDGEEALVVATREKPDLIITDVMMPKLSGFEMLETLKAAPEMSKVKVMMMTALGQAEDRTRGEKLGVVKYLVKSQVTLEDFVRVTREVLPPKGPEATAADAPEVQKANSKSTNDKVSEGSMQDDNSNQPAAPADGTNPIGGSDAAAPADDQMSSSEEQKVVDSQVSDFTASAPADAPAADPAAATGGDAPGVTPSTPPAEETPPAPEDPATPPAPAV